MRALPLPLAADPAAEILIAYEMNGEPLKPGHGAPFRLVVFHWFAVASVKWLHRIDVLTEPCVREFETGHYRARTSSSLHPEAPEAPRPCPDSPLAPPHA